MAVQSTTSLDAGPLRISWSAPEGCPPASDVLGRVRTLLASELATVLHHPLEVRAQVVQLESGRYQLELEIHEGGESGARTIEAATCQELVPAGALVIALTIDPELLERAHADAAGASGSPASSAEAGAAAKSAAPAATPLPAQPPQREAARAATERASGAADDERLARRRAVTFGPGFRLVGDAGGLPGFGVGLDLSLHAEWRALRLELAGVWLPSRDALAASDASVGGSIQLLALGARACSVSVFGPLSGGVCGAFELGQLRAEAFGADHNGSGRARWISSGLGLNGRYRLSKRLLVAARVEGLFPLERSEFTVENIGSVYAPSSVTGRFALGLDVDF